MPEIQGVGVEDVAPSAEKVASVSVSVAVCTRERPEQLARALRSLHDQTLPPREILVVDNAPASDRTRGVVTGAFPQARYAREAARGLDFARNRALRLAAGEVVAFIDDDAVADREWVRRVAAVFADPDVGACTGLVEPLHLETPAQRLFEANGGLFSPGRIPVRLPAPRPRLRGRQAPLIACAVSVGTGCNLAVRRSVAAELDGFDEALDLGAALPGGGDIDLLWRVLEAGHHVVYEPAAVVRHEHRRELDAAADQIVGHQRALVAFLWKTLPRTRGRGRLEMFAFLLWRLVKPGVRLARRATGRDPLPAPLLFRMWWNCWRGLTSYAAARRLSQARRGGAACGT